MSASLAVLVRDTSALHANSCKVSLSLRFLQKNFSYDAIAGLIINMDDGEPLCADKIHNE